MQLPILQVIIPIIAAICCFLTKKHKISWLISLITTITTLTISFLLLIKTYNGTVITYNVGDWVPPHGIELRIDLLNSLIITLVNFIALMSVLYGFHVNEKEISQNKITGFYSLFLLCLSGLLGILVTNDIFNLYVFLEITSLSAYVLVSMGKDKEALVAAFEYLISGTIGATFYLFGIGLLYSMTGTLNMQDLADRIQPNQIVHLGLAFIFVGLAVKMALFPLSNWMVNAYSHAPTFVSVFFSGTVTKVMIYVFIRIFSIYNPSTFNNVAMILALAAILYGSVYAIIINDIKRLLAYSSISQIGYIVLALSLNAKVAAILHMLNHSIIKSSLFMAVGCITYQSHTIENLRKSMPHVALAFTILSLALIGIPLTGSFVSKWYIIQAAIESNAWIALMVCAVGSFITLIYVLKIIEKMYFSNANTHSTRVPLNMLSCLLFMTGLTLITGIIFFKLFINITI
ncbi:cation:proton antiporter [Wolbachia pipientis]|uniref:Cation:proton antiporter n=1 Tax=Wolbachia pipientis TaxID=955 RepID=A0A1E7QKX2_WOLPI|nr:proton-conducting transporter membrane subunit [Wolbachia pipientis]OEY87125.1 cation:proton antiporter [Wolbachia pipientis]